MRVLFDNLVLSGTLTTDTPSDSYPVTNLSHQFLRRRYQIVTSPVTVTVTFDEDSTVNCFFYGYHTATSLTLRLYDSGDVLQKTVLVTSPESGVGSEFFDDETAIAYAEIDIAGSNPLYLGGIGLGEYYELPRPLANFSEGLSDRSVTSSSPQGQSQFLHVAALKRRAYTFPSMTRTERNAVEALFVEHGVGRPMWIDAFYGNHTFEPPMYARVVSPWATVKDASFYDAERIEFEEAR